jgi:3-methyladenine DNA glycosylase AlkD
MTKIIDSLRDTLKQNADPKILQSTNRFFKEKVICYGSKTADVSKLGKEYFKKLKDLPKSEIFKLCDELWKSQYLEESFIACHWAFSLRNQYERKDFDIFEGWVNNYVTNWASCDTLCNHTIGTFIEMYPDYIQKLQDWAKSENRWVRRAAAVSLIIPARKGLFLNEIFKIAELLLCDKDDLVQKGYGWMLKAASESHQNEVFDFVMSKKSIMPRTSLRYAIEKMPKDLKEMAMQK